MQNGCRENFYLKIAKLWILALKNLNFGGNIKKKNLPAPALKKGGGGLDELGK